MDFTTLVKTELDKRQITKSQFARMTGYSPQYISSLLRGHKRWNETVIAKACTVLGIEMIFKPQVQNIPSSQQSDDNKVTKN